MMFDQGCYLIGMKFNFKIIVRTQVSTNIVPVRGFGYMRYLVWVDERCMKQCLLLSNTFKNNVYLVNHTLVMISKWTTVRNT